MLLSLGIPYYKEGCKLSWSEEDIVLKHKNKIKRETLALHEHIEYFSVTVGVGSPDVSQNS